MSIEQGVYYIVKGYKTHLWGAYKCHKRFYKTRTDQTCCSNCRGYKKIGIKTIICCDCGKEFEVDSSSRSKRCDKCSHIAILDKNKRYNDKRRIKK